MNPQSWPPCVLSGHPPLHESSSMGCLKAVMSLNVQRNRTTLSCSLRIGAIFTKNHTGVPEERERLSPKCSDTETHTHHTRPHLYISLLEKRFLFLLELRLGVVRPPWKLIPIHRGGACPACPHITPSLGVPCYCIQELCCVLWGSSCISQGLPLGLAPSLLNWGVHCHWQHRHHR